MLQMSKWRKGWRFWTASSAALLVLAVVSFHVVAHLLLEPPPYSEIEPGLYLGGYVNSPPGGTEVVLNLCEAKDPYEAPWHRWEPIRDAAPAPDLEWLRDQVNYIEEHRGQGRQVFVHCRGGASRGGMVVAAYLMAKHRWSRDEALAQARQRREVIRPNPAFMVLLSEWEDWLNR